MNADSRKTHSRSALKSRGRLSIASAVITVGLLVAPLLPALRANAVDLAQSKRGAISDVALDQIRSLMEAKAARSPVERKIDSNILGAVKVLSGLSLAADASVIQLDVKIDQDDAILVDISATVTDEVLEAIRQVGGEVYSIFAEYDSIRARLPLSGIESVAALDDVRFINRQFESQTHSGSPRTFGSGRAAFQNPTSQERETNVRARLATALAEIRQETASSSIVPQMGSATSQGETAHRAAEARATFSVNGAGVKVGVLSDSFNTLGGAAADVASGDLPGPGNPNGFTTPVTVLQEPASGSDEGRAMLQIVHDIAPGAQLFFATAFGGPANFANNIQALRNAGCDIVIDDVLYLNESPFQDDIISQAVNTVTAAGALYFSSAGNAGNLNDGTSGVWEGDFNDSGTDFIVGSTNLGRLHRFGPASIFNTCNAGGSQRRVDLFWSDALGQSANDYDLYILDSTGTNVVRFSDSFQDGNDNPYEAVGTLNVAEKIAVVKFSGSARFIYISTGRGRLAIATAGQERGHACAVNAFSVAAVNAAAAGGGAFTGGASNPIETFSSDGPRRIFYNADGTAITPGNVLSTGGTVRQKPDIAAADGVATTLPPGSGLNPFFGTSAAAPHAGAIAALVKSANPSLTAAQIRAALTTTALDIEAAGVDRDSGSGIAMAFPAIQLIGNTHMLAVASQNPASGVNITVSPNDTGGMGSGVTQFVRTYNHNTVVTLTAPATAGGNNFEKWQRDGIDFTTNQTAIITVDANRTMTAVYTTATVGGDGIGLYSPSSSTFFLRNSNSPGVADVTFSYGPASAGWIPISGDWNGDGSDTAGLYSPSSGMFFLRNSNSAGVADVTFAYGPAGAGWIPISGDWNDDGTDTVGLYSPSSSMFFLRNSNSPGIADVTFAYGPAGAGWIPISGDWNGDGRDTIGLYSPSSSMFFLRNSNSAGIADVTFSYGPASAGWMPIVGDWNGDGTDTVGLYSPSSSMFFLRNSNSPGVADVTFAYGSAGSGWIPVTGGWDGL